MNLSRHSLFLFCLLSLCSCRAQITTTTSLDISKDIVVPKMYHVQHMTQDIIIDGKADEAIWSEANFTDDFIDIEGIKIPKHKSKVKMLWDDINLYIYAELEEDHIAANLIKHDTVIFYDKNFEVFIDPTDDTYNYVELELNALNTTWDLFLDKPYRVKGHADNSYEIAGLQTAVHINGSLNDNQDSDESWTVEIAIPLVAILEAGKSNKQLVAPGDYWRMNFSRVHWDQEFRDGTYHRLLDENGDLKKAYNWVWSNQKVINMHEPEKWGYLFFAGAKETSFTRPSDYLDKQVAYALWRHTRRKGELRYLRKKDAGYQQKIVLQKVQDTEYLVDFIKEDEGYAFLIENSDSKTSFSINEDGWFQYTDR